MDKGQTVAPFSSLKGVMLTHFKLKGDEVKGTISKQRTPNLTVHRVPNKNEW